ncbi:MAG: hypothetical protein JXL97_00300 [Bacteroidales bacterium]|nr:hypothetical protein [Bacteroidales bacterium]
MADKRILGIVLILISFLLGVIFFRVMISFAIFLFVLGFLVILNPNEDKIEPINYGGLERKRRSYKNEKK